MDDLRLPELVRSPARQQRAALKRLSSPDRLASLLDALTADEASARRVASLSYRHPLGFDKYVLWCRHPAGRVRLHVWWPEAERGREHIHNHRYAFSSAVVIALVRSELFEETREGSPYTRFIDRTTPQTDGWQLEQTDPIKISHSATLEMTTGSAYSQAAGTFHRVDVAGGLAVTLFLEGVVTRPHSEVLIGPGQRFPEWVPRVEFNRDELRRRLGTLSHLLRDR